jgi:flagellar M-ring protein FliF
MMQLVETQKEQQMEAEEQGIAQRNRTGPPESSPPIRKNLITLVREWPTSRQIATGAVLLISIILFALLILKARTANQQLLYANLSMNDAGAVV